MFFSFLTSEVTHEREILFLFHSHASEVNLFLSLWKNLGYLLVFHENMPRHVILVVHGSPFNLKFKTCSPRKASSSIYLIISSYSFSLFSSSGASIRCWIFLISSLSLFFCLFWGVFLVFLIFILEHYLYFLYFPFLLVICI